MSEAQHLSFLVSSILFTVVFLSQAGEVASLKAGKVNVTTKGPGLFACEQVGFAAPFTSGQEVKILASFGHALKRPTRGHGAALWLESIRNSGFRICVLEFGDGSNGTGEVNWIALQSAPSGAQTGTASLNSWATGTECKKVYFPQRFLTPPKILVTPSHQFPGRPQDATAVWVEHLREESVKICARETKMFDGLHQNIKIQWLAFTSLGIENVTLTDSLVFASNNTSPPQKNCAVCQKVNFTNPFFAPPVVVVTPKSNNSSQSGSTSCDAITAWVEYTSVRETEICVRSYDSQQDAIEVDYVAVGDLDPCLDVTCHYHGLCKAFGPRDARCVCINNCPSYQEPVCSSKGKSYDNICLFKREMCGLELNYTVQHPGSCEGFPFQRGRRHMPHIPSLGYSHCEVIPFSPYVFYPDKPIAVQITVNHIDTSDMSYVHDAAVSWVENVYYHQFTACVMAAGFNERKSTANVTVDWIAYQGAPVGGVAGEVRISQWWTGTTCETVNFPLGKFLVQPSVFVTAKHNNPGLKRDACSLWVEDITQTSCKICMRELQNYAGAHKDIYVNWMAFSYLHKPPFSEHNSIYFVNNRPPDAQHNDAYCKDVAFASVYNVTPHVFVSANHSTTGGNLSPVYNGITAWVEYINKTGFRVCFKELYGTRYDPLSVAYTVLSEICPSGWGYFNGYCYFTSSVCAAWLTAVSNCSAMASQLVTVHNQEENVYIQHRHNGEKSWIGLNDRSVEGSFVWTNKEISSFRFWAPRQPNNWRNEDCVHALGARHGYTWNDVPCDNCYNFTCFKVIDECITNYHSCDVNAICQDTVGSYVCTCKAGYSGDGRSCLDIDECATSTHGCDVNAVCYNSVGSHACTCKTGFSGNGRICIDNDECSSNTHDCDVNAVCNNTVGSYNCVCKSGFTGNGTTCLVAYKSCAEVYKVGGSNVNGVYKIDPDGLGEFEVFCDQKTAGGGWTVFQRRQDGSVNFYRGWYDYKRGFGNLTGEFWLGLDKIHRLTVGGSNKLRVDLEDFNSNTAFAEYSSIVVANEMAKYQLTLGSYGGTAGDSMSYHSGSHFTTKDRDNDQYNGNCAVRDKGAFWYKHCHNVNLNGKYQPGISSWDGVVWYHWRSYNSLKKTEMKMRPNSF